MDTTRAGSQEIQCSVVIRAFNEAAHIGRLLEGIGRQSGVRAEIIVVDSGSTDSTVELAKEHGARVLHIPSAEFTFGRSLNLGLHAASHEYVVLASAHVYPLYPDWIQCLLQPFEDPGVAIVYGKQRGGPGSNFSERQIFRQWYPDADARDRAGPFCNNANAAIRRSLWERNPYDESLTGLEDVAWAKWALQERYAVHYAAQAEIVHVHRETPHAVYNRYRREAMAFKRIFSEAHFSLYDFARLATSNIASDLGQAARAARPWEHVLPVLWFRAAQFWGTYQGYRHAGPVTQRLRETFYYPRGHGAPASPERPIEPIRYRD
jgi:glycosyltransferase involved in cell wall biosynthesis